MDFLVNLYHDDFNRKLIPNVDSHEIVIKRVLPPQKKKVLKFIEENFSEQWASEAEMSFSHINPTIFIAVRNKEIIGFSCYDATAKGYFGPIGISDEHRKRGIGETLTLTTLKAMKNDGYGYSIVGAASGALKFYERFLNAEVIESSKGGSIYNRMI